jgi:ankyrin repeat protein
MLTGADDVPLQEREVRATPLHHLANLADPCDYSTHENQLILAKQLIEHRANANPVSIPQGSAPLHTAYFGGNVTDLDIVELLLKGGADPNAQDRMGRTPLMWTASSAPGAAKFLLKWPTTDVNITLPSGVFFLNRVCSTITTFPTKLRALITPTGSNTSSCSSSGVTSKRCWWKGVPMIPGS